MEANFKQNSGLLEVELSGDLIGGADAMTFSQSLKEAIAGAQSHPLTAVAIGASRVGFVNSSGLGMLLAARQAAKDAGAELAILNPPAQLRSLLEITKLTDILGVTA